MAYCDCSDLTGPCRVGSFVRVQPCADASAGVALRQKINGNEQAAQNNKADQILPVRTAERHEDKAERQNDERRRHVRFEVEQHGDDAAGSRHRAPRRSGSSSLSRVCAAIMAANEQMTPNFAISDGWKLTKPKSSQRVAPPLVRADDRHEDQQADGHSQDQERQLLIPFVWHAADEPHHTDAHHGKDEPDARSTEAAFFVS